MKLVPIREVPDEPDQPGSGFNTPGLLKVILENPPQGITYGEMRARDPILDKIKTLKEGATSLLLEDAEHSILRGAIESHKFGRGTQTLFAVLKEVMEAQTPAAEPAV